MGVAILEVHLLEPLVSRHQPGLEPILVASAAALVEDQSVEAFAVEAAVSEIEVDLEVVQEEEALGIKEVGSVEGHAVGMVVVEVRMATGLLPMHLLDREEEVGSAGDSGALLTV